jgi:hypothetical protein
MYGDVLGDVPGEFGYKHMLGVMSLMIRAWRAIWTSGGLSFQSNRVWFANL